VAMVEALTSGDAALLAACAHDRLHDPIARSSSLILRHSEVHRCLQELQPFLSQGQVRQPSLCATATSMLRLYEEPS
jgi:hypothetical protein